jgi:hypothetical protein
MGECLNAGFQNFVRHTMILISLYIPGAWLDT